MGRRAGGIEFENLQFYGEDTLFCVEVEKEGSETTRRKEGDPVEQPFDTVKKLR